MDPGLVDERTAPRCQKCDYIVIGLPGDRCPECGTPIDWPAVRAEADRPGMPIEHRAGWGRIVAGVHTWLLVLLRPFTFARRLSERFSVWPATGFALTCMALGIAGNTLVGLDSPGWDLAVLAWVIGCWFHIECQSLLFFLLDWRQRNRLRLWSFWRKVSLYTTAFVVLDWAAGPPMMDGYTDAGNFPWILDWDLGHLRAWWPPGSNELYELARAVAYYWWMGVLMVVLWVRLRRKWCLLFILAAMPGVTMISCRVGYHSAEFLESAFNAIPW